MKLIAKQAALPWAKQQLKHQENLQLTFYSFKKDRQISLIKTGDKVTLIEAGFVKETYANLTLPAALKLLKKRMATEFPRSHNLYCQMTKP